MMIGVSHLKPKLAMLGLAVLGATASFAQTAQIKTHKQAVSFLMKHRTKNASPQAITGLDSIFAINLAQLIAEAPPAIAKNIYINNGYRSDHEQQVLRNRYKKIYGNRLDDYVAPVGQSTHGDGLAVDLWFCADPNNRKVQDKRTVQYVYNHMTEKCIKAPLLHEPWHFEDERTRPNPLVDTLYNFYAARDLLVEQGTGPLGNPNLLQADTYWCTGSDFIVPEKREPSTAEALKLEN